MSENQEDNMILGRYKQTNAILMVFGLLLGTYAINSNGFNNLLASIIAVVVVVYGAYQYYKIDGKIGIFLVSIAILWAIGYSLLYLKVFFNINNLLKVFQVKFGKNSIIFIYYFNNYTIYIF